MTNSNSVTDAGNLPRVISDVEVLHKATFVSGPRIGRVQTIEFNGVISEVNFWFNNDGSLHHVA